MKTVVIINGSNGVGKDTFIDLCKESKIPNKGVIWNISTVDKVKTAAKILGWNGEKDEASRAALHEIKMISNKYFDSSFLYVRKHVDNQLFDNDIMFVHCREPEEITRFKKELTSESVKVLTLLIKREDSSIANNYADQSVNNYEYDIVIENNKDIESLKYSAYKFLENYIYNKVLDKCLLSTIRMGSIMKNVVKNIGKALSV